MKRWTIAIFVLAGLTLPLVRQAHATLSAHLKVYAVDNECRVEDEYDPYNPFGNTEPPDLSFRAAVMQWDGQFSYRDVCDSAGPDDCCCYWDIDPNVEVARNIPNGQTAWFYFGLFDVDNADADDSVGNHFVNPWTSMSSAAWTANNDDGYPDFQPVCGDENE